jgi:hypothetical protein
MTRATGTFDVKLQPVDNYEPAIGRMSLDKTFAGDLQGSSRGEMLAHRTAVQGSAAYCAMELITGTLHGKSGTFVFAHRGIMDRGTPSLVATIVPDSGTGELTGLSGSFKLINEGKDHSYELEYSLPQG